MQPLQPNPKCSRISLFPERDLTMIKLATCDVYPGIDLVYFGDGNSLEHDFRVAPFGDPGLIRLRIGGGAARVDRARGDLIVSSPDLGVEMMRLRQPVGYRLRSDGSRATLAAGYSEAEYGSFQFSLDAQ